MPSLPQKRTQPISPTSQQRHKGAASRPTQATIRKLAATTMFEAIRSGSDRYRYEPRVPAVLLEQGWVDDDISRLNAVLRDMAFEVSPIIERLGNMA